MWYRFESLKFHQIQFKTLLFSQFFPSIYSLNAIRHWQWICLTHTECSFHKIPYFCFKERNFLWFGALKLCWIGNGNTAERNCLKSSNESFLRNFLSFLVQISGKCWGIRKWNVEKPKKKQFLILVRNLSLRNTQRTKRKQFCTFHAKSWVVSDDNCWNGQSYLKPSPAYMNETNLKNNICWK